MHRVGGGIAPAVLPHHRAAGRRTDGSVPRRFMSTCDRLQPDILSLNLSGRTRRSGRSHSPWLSRNWATRPRKVVTLKNTINTLFLKKLDDAELTGLVEHMRQKDLIVIDKEKISYKPPISQP